MTRFDDPQAALDYRRIEKLLRFLHENRVSQPSLQELADAARLSPFHLQRLFTRWAGTSPKHFLQFLSREHAKTLLAEGASVLEAAHAAGMSSGSRLQDLFVRTEGLTPGEHKSGGAGLAIRWGVHASPFGPCFAALTERGVCAMAFVDDQDALERALADLRDTLPAAALARDDERAASVVRRAFARERLDVLLVGSPFQLRVWQALLELPPGRVASYGELASHLGMPRAARAVGTAVAQNRVAYLIPCHRVIRAIGESGEYRWGALRKRAMLARESALAT